jgi:hypothetical protein
MYFENRNICSRYTLDESNFTRYRHFISIIDLSFGLLFFDIWNGHNIV